MQKAIFMKDFNDNDFLLMNDYGKKLYHNVAAALPIIDPHNHIDTAALASGKQFKNLYQLWIQQDPYKHRAMRICGIPEDLITGNKPDYDKFLAWAGCLKHTAGNPLFHWSCMELKELFGIKELLSAENAKQIWDTANKLLKKNEFTALKIVQQFGVEMLCTSDDLTDTLEHHSTLAKMQSDTTCLPSLRGDSIIGFDQPGFCDWLVKLQHSTRSEVHNLDEFKRAVIQRLDFFDEAGCLLSDHAFDSGFTYTQTESGAANELFKKVLNKEILTGEAYTYLRSHLLHFLGLAYAKRKWKMQLHVGAYRNTSTSLRNRLGAAGGYACIGNTVNVRSLCFFLDELDKESGLPKTILYNLNPADNAVFASITGSFSEDGVQGKIQFGAAWWYNDHYEGILQQLLALSGFGLLSVSIGMTTDSRSILSFVRHNYYRRILCNLLGGWVEDGRLPDDWQLLSTMVQNISYDNIKNWIKK